MVSPTDATTPHLQKAFRAGQESSKSRNKDMIWRSNYLAKYNNDNISQNNLFTASWVVKILRFICLFTSISRFTLCHYRKNNNINTIDKNNNPKPNGWRNLWYALMLAWLLNTNSPTYAQTNNSNYNTTEQIDSSNIDKLNSIKSVKNTELTTELYYYRRYEIKKLLMLFWGFME